ncbi:MAG: hypothetical protein ACJ76S_03795 [Solirubrobacteraceae bacterium]
MTPSQDKGAPSAPGVPPVGEEIHLPEPSLIPVLSALGVTLAVVGLVISWLITAAGLAIVVLTTVRWIRDTRRDIDELPLEH